MYAETVGVTMDHRNMMRVCSAWGNNQSQRCSGKLVLVPLNMLMKWALKVEIAFSAKFLWWSCGGTSWYVVSFFLIVALNSSKHSLSVMWCLGMIPALLSRSIRH